MTDRYKPFRDIAATHGANAVALVPGANFTRLFGASFHTSERPLVVLIPRDGAPLAIVPNLELASFDLIGFEGKVFDWRDQDGYAGAFLALASETSLRRICVEGQIMRVFVAQALEAAFPGLSLIDAEKQISGLRQIKTNAEISAMEAAISISERALMRTIEQFKIGMTEKQVEGLLVGHLFAQGADGHAFDPIVAAGANSALPHAHARHDYAIQSGDALLIDFEATSGGLCADITRTFFAGKASDEAREVYHIVREANEAGIAATRAGQTAHAVDDTTTRVLEQSDFADRIRTKTGHGLGRQVHEAPYIMRGNHEILREGAVFTIEPGLYGEGRFGVRIEDDVLVTASGCRVLTTFPKDLMEIG